MCREHGLVGGLVLGVVDGDEDVHGAASELDVVVIGEVVTELEPQLGIGAVAGTSVDPRAGWFNGRKPDLGDGYH